MIYQKIVDLLLGFNAEFEAAILLDHEGETVVAAHRRGDSENHRVLGAYQGIYLRDLSRAFERCGLSDISAFTMDAGESRIFTRLVKDGYYLVLLASREVPAGIARHHLDRTASDLVDLL
jgi:hypothetical protein